MSFYYYRFLGAVTELEFGGWVGGPYTHWHQLYNGNGRNIKAKLDVRDIFFVLVK
ncbi:hypothetical protein [Sutcliffiella halmapala]|uniref:hypothetical protein n=1 Tax=Sutcliffiella halmapala TaxID=79882 RepID=UPI0014741C98|nr:hypothetical protein [Sutcliffiella halmapala]